MKDVEDLLTHIDTLQERDTRQDSFRYIDLFAGIGGFSFAAQKHGGKLVFASEIDKFAAEAFEVIHGFKPDGDITKIHEDDVPDHDLILGGFPCQAFSVAGRRRGLEDARGTLFFDIARIAQAKKPKALVLENVKGLINHDKGKTFELMLTMLNEIGYVVDFEVLNSKYFGVPQNRERVFIVAVRSDLIDTEPWEPKGSTIVPKAKRRLADKLDTFNLAWSTERGEAKRLRDILEPEVDENFYLSEDKTAKLISELEEKSPENGGKLGFLPTPDGINNTLRSGGAGSLTAKHCYDRIAIPAPRDAVMVGLLDIKGQENTRRVYSPEGVSPTLTTMGGGNREPKIANIEVIGHTGTGGQRGRVISGQGLSPCLSATESKQPTQIAVREAPNNEIAVVEESPIYKWRIRKLTPLECWRLQGFPDEAHEAVKAHGISNSQRYKQAGNAVTVNVVESVLSDLINSGIFLL